MQIGIIGRCDNKGLGNMTWEFFSHIKPVKTLIVANKYTRHLERMPDATVVPIKPSGNLIKGFLDGLDVVVAMESPYNPDLFRIAKGMNVKSVLIPMYEFFDNKWEKPDLYLCPSLVEFLLVDGHKEYIPWPVNTKVLKRRRPTQAKRFLYNRGYGGVKDRNSYDNLIEAIRLVKNDVEFIINSQGRQNRENYWDMWGNGDIFVFPHKFGGLSLPIQEAMATGLPVITTDFYPFNTIINKKLLMKPDDKTVEVISRKIKFHHLYPETIAEKIDEVARMSGEEIGELSDEMYEYAETISWDNLLQTFLKTFKELL